MTLECLYLWGRGLGEINLEYINSKLHRISHKDHHTWPLPSWPALSSEVSTQTHAKLLLNQMYVILLLRAPVP